MLLAERHHVLTAGAGEQQQRQRQPRLGAERELLEELFHVGDGPCVITAALYLLDCSDVSGAVRRQMIVVDAPAAQGGQMLAPARSSTRVIGLQLDQPPDLLGGDVLERTIP